MSARADSRSTESPLDHGENSDEEVGPYVRGRLLSRPHGIHTEIHSVVLRWFSVPVAPSEGRGRELNIPVSWTHRSNTSAYVTSNLDAVLKTENDIATIISKIRLYEIEIAPSRTRCSLKSARWFSKRDSRTGT